MLTYRRKQSQVDGIHNPPITGEIFREEKLIGFGGGETCEKPFIYICNNQGGFSYQKSLHDSSINCTLCFDLRPTHGDTLLDVFVHFLIFIFIAFIW